MQHGADSRTGLPKDQTGAGSLNPNWIGHGRDVSESWAGGTSAYGAVTGGASRRHVKWKARASNAECPLVTSLEIVSPSAVRARRAAKRTAMAIRDRAMHAAPMHALRCAASEGTTECQRASVCRSTFRTRLRCDAATQRR